MKLLVIGFLALVAAVQARSTGLESGPETGLSTAGSPWVVHLRIAYSNTGGRLSSCVGSLISNRYVLTAASCLEQARFIWIRYGASNVISPELVTESSSISQFADIGIVSINRAVEFTPTISAVQLADQGDNLPESGTFCGYGAGENNSPGENLSCSEWSLEPLDNDNFEGISESGEATIYDLGAPLVKDGVQYGVLIRLPRVGTNAVFVNPAAYRWWIDREISQY